MRGVPDHSLRDRAASGIGRATAVAFVAEGARVAILDLTETALQETAHAVRRAGDEVLTIACDASKSERVEAAVARKVERFGRLDIGLAPEKWRVSDEAKRAL